MVDAGADGSTLWGIGGAWTNWDFLKMSFEEATGTKYKRLVFDGGATAVNNVASGDCAVATPFVSEALDGFESVMWRSFAAPAGTPEDVVKTLSDAVGKVCQNEEFIKKATEAGLTIEYKGGGEFKTYYEENHEKVKEMIDNANFES